MSISVFNKHFILGTSDFDELIEKNAFFIDKTLFIKEFTESPAKVAVILRPRRFGKSTNLSMLKSFLSLGASPESFKNYAISKETKFVEQHCGKYPVVCLNLKDCKGETWEEMYRNVWLSIREMVKRHENELKGFDLSPFELNKTHSVVSDDVTFVAYNLKWLIASLYEKYQQRVIVLVDEYDAPLNYAFRKGFYEKASSFFEYFYSAALKDNSSLEKACLMGIVEVRGAGILSGLNNSKVFSVANGIYSQFFGFTEEEISGYAGNDLIQVLQHYNGYTIGSQRLINPWSFMSWMLDQEFSSYWIDTSNIETLSTILSPHVNTVLQTTINFVFNQEYQHEIPKLATSVNYGSKNLSEASIWHFLIHTGYLTYRHKNGTKDRGYACVPNEEVRSHWESEMKKLMDQAFTPMFQDGLRKALSNLDVQSLETIMKEMILFPSFCDVSPENSYHMFYFGSFFTILHNGIDVFVSSNKEAGHGRFDIRIVFRAINKAIVMEFKKSKDEEKLDADAKEAFEQIISCNYLAEIRNCECLVIGASFYTKEMSAFKWKVVPKFS